LPVVATLEDLDEPSLKLILTQPKNALVKQYQRLFEMESIDRSHAGGGGAGRYCPQGHRPQDRRARPALDYGRYPARHHVRPAEPRRSRGGRDLERGRRGYRAAALHLCRPCRPDRRRERIVGRALLRAACKTSVAV